MQRLPGIHKIMDTLIIGLTILLTLLGLGVAIWSILDTRKKRGETPVFAIGKEHDSSKVVNSMLDGVYTSELHHDVFAKVILDICENKSKSKDTKIKEIVHWLETIVADYQSCKRRADRVECVDTNLDTRKEISNKKQEEIKNAKEESN